MKGIFTSAYTTVINDYYFYYNEHYELHLCYNYAWKREVVLTKQESFKTSLIKYSKRQCISVFRSKFLRKLIEKRLLNKIALLCPEMHAIICILTFDKCNKLSWPKPPFLTLGLAF